MKVVFVDDDDIRRGMYLEFAKVYGWEADSVESVYDANQQNADFYVFDISAVCPFMWDLSHAYAPIARLMQDHPDAKIVIVSGVSRNEVMEVIKQVEEETGRRPIYGGYGEMTDIKKAIDDNSGV